MSQSPVDQMRSTLKFYQGSLIGLLGILALSVLAVPVSMKKDQMIVVNREGIAEIKPNEPWKHTTTRIESFTKHYLSQRFEWNKTNFEVKKEILKHITSDAVFGRLKDSFTAFEALAQNQDASCYYVLEGFGFSNSQKKIEARITRILRVKNVGLATPLVIRISFQEAILSEANPYGLIIDGLEEVEVKESP